MTSWPTTAAEAIAVQEELRGLVDPTDTTGSPRYVAGLDVAYDGDRLAAAVVVLAGIPSIGAAKTAFIGTHKEPAGKRGATADLMDGESGWFTANEAAQLTVIAGHRPILPAVFAGELYFDGPNG